MSVSASERLQSLGIDTAKPGFYDDRVFRMHERLDPSFLETYAAFVEERVRDAAYEDHVRQAAKRVAEFFYERLMRDGRQGACVDAAMVVSRFLERLGIWNYCGKGGVTVEFANGIPSSHLAPVGGRRDKAAGHAWVVAPPIKVLDVTIHMQAWSPRAQQHLPRYVLAERAERTKAGPEDWLDPDLYSQEVRNLGRLPTMDDLRRRLPPGHIDRATELGIWQVREGPASIRYLTTGIGAPEEPLEEIRSLRLSGKWGLELWRDFEADPSRP